MKTICKKYTPADYDGIIGFFRELHKTSNHTQYWLPQRFEYAEFFIALLHKNRGVKIDWKETIFLWEDEKGKVVALLCSESPDENSSNALSKRETKRTLTSKKMELRAR